MLLMNGNIETTSTISLVCRFYRGAGVPILAAVGNISLTRSGCRVNFVKARNGHMTGVVLGRYSYLVSINTELKLERINRCMGGFTPGIRFVEYSVSRCRLDQGVGRGRSGSGVSTCSFVGRLVSRSVPGCRR